MVLLIIFTLLLEVQPQRLSAQVWLTESTASMQKDTNAAQLRYDRPTDAQGADQSHHKFLNQKERPVITVTHDPQTGDFIIYCQIPGSENTVYACFIYIGDENRQIIKSQKPSGRTQCISTIHKTYLFNHLKSVKSKVMSCSYSPEPSSSKHSPYSDKFNLTVFLPVQIQSPNTTKASASYSTPTFFTNETTTTLATESTTWYETKINPTAESTHASHLLNVTRNTTAVLKASTPGDHTTPRRKTWLIMALAATSGGIVLTGLMGICLSCIRQNPREKSPLKTSAAISQSPDEDDAEENEEKRCHIYCTIPDVPEDTHELYSLAQMPNHSLLI